MLRRHLPLLFLGLPLAGCHSMNVGLSGGQSLAASDVLNKVTFKSAHYENKKTGESLDVQGFGSDPTEAILAARDIVHDLTSVIPAGGLPLLATRAPIAPPRPATTQAIQGR